MVALHRSAEQDAALRYIQDTMKPQAGALLDQAAAELADVPADDLDRQINNLGHVLMLTFKKIAPDLPESIHYALPFAFIELLRERMSSRWHRKAFI